LTSHRIEREFLLISGMSVAYFIGGQILTPILPLFFVEVGASKVELGIIMAVPSLVAIASRIPLSTLMDRFGKWVVVILSSIVSIMAIAAYAFTYQVLWLYVIGVFNALSWVLYQPASMALALDLSPPNQRAESMGRYFMVIAATFLIGPLLASFLTLYLDFRSVFLLSVIPSVVGLLAVILLGRIRLVRSEGTVSRYHISLKDLRELFRIRQYWAVSIASATFWMATSVFGTLFSVYCEERLLLTASAISLLFAVRGLSNTLVRIPAGRISDRIGRRRPVLAAYVMGSVVFWGLSEFSTVPLFMLVMFAYGLSWGMKVVSETALLGDIVPSERRGVAMAVWQTIDDVGFVAGSLAAGASTLYMDAPSFFRIMSLVLTLGICIVVFLVREAAKSDRDFRNTDDISTRGLSQ